MSNVVDGNGRTVWFCPAAQGGMGKMAPKQAKSRGKVVRAKKEVKVDLEGNGESQRKTARGGKKEEKAIKKEAKENGKADLKREKGTAKKTKVEVKEEPMDDSKANLKKRRGANLENGAQFSPKKLRSRK